VSFNDQDLSPDKPLPQPHTEESYMVYLDCMVQFARLGGEIWDMLFSAAALRQPQHAETIAILDAKIKHWIDDVLPSRPLVPQHANTSLRHRRQRCLVYTRAAHLRLLLRRRLMVSMNFSAADGRLCGNLAMDIVKQISQHSNEAGEQSSFRFHMAVSLGSALLILSTLLCRGLVDLQNFYAQYSEAFRTGLTLLRQLGKGLHAARRKHAV
jgi:hypothetical protein